MKFGKLPDISQVNFELPPLEDTQYLFNANEPDPSFRLYVGCPRWASKEWVGKIYPPKAKAADYLRYYAQSFNGIELNSTHYQIPSSERVAQWRSSVPPHFRFSPKVPQMISHHRKLKNVGTELEVFISAIRGFGKQLGQSFLQLHESFGPEFLPNLNEFLDLWPRDLSLAIEFRHPAWFQQHRLIPEAESLLSQRACTSLITDVSGRRDVLHQSLTSSTVMLRFVGNGLHPSDYTRADAWVERLIHWREKGIREVYFFAHEPGDALAVDLGTYVIQQFNQAMDLNLRLPGLPDQGAGDQMSLFG
ncbi:MAG: DUF72 domain-containing protein [Bacteroidota bacterium]